MSFSETHPIQSILKDLLISDLYEDISKRYPEIESSTLKNKINDKVISINPQFAIETKHKKKKQVKIDDCDRCCARTWDNHRGSRCSHQIKSDDYCGIHLREINERGSLLFGRYDEPKPTINDQGNIIPWYDGPPLEELDAIVNYLQCCLLRKMKRESIKRS